jgi:transcriptional regulator with GAF, ATPase, and Fis domain
VLNVGREVAEQGLRIADVKLSRMHFRVTWDGRSRAYRVGDAGSANGTYVNGLATESAILVENDVVRAGQTLFVVCSSLEPSPFEVLLQSVARSSLPVLLLGETGAGKEVAAQTIHDLSGRNGDFVPVNCAALPKELAASELFGHTRAAFSGAKQPRVGLFQTAAGGTLFLDEIGELPLDLQPLLLRALQDGKVRALGSDREESVDVRVIAATNVDLEGMISSGRFRADLYARLAHQIVNVPPLRQRKSDILRLVAGFAGAKCNVSADAAEALLLWDYEYNVRELKGIVQRIKEQARSGQIDLAALKSVAPQLVSNLDAARNAAGITKVADPVVARPSRAELARLLAEHDGNVSAVAVALSTSRTQLYRWLKGYGIEWRR